MTNENISLQRRDHGERSEGPREKKPIYSLICDECGRAFDCVDAGARKCPRCLWRELRRNK